MSAECAEKLHLGQVADRDLLTLLDVHDGPDLLPLEVVHDPGPGGVGNTRVVDEMDVVVETKLSVAVQSRNITDLKVIIVNDPEHLGHFVTFGFLVEQQRGILSDQILSSSSVHLLKVLQGVWQLSW